MNEAPIRYLCPPGPRDCLFLVLPGPLTGLSNGLLIASIVSLSLESLLLLTVTYLGRTQWPCDGPLLVFWWSVQWPAYGFYGIYIIRITAIAHR